MKLKTLIVSLLLTSVFAIPTEVYAAGEHVHKKPAVEMFSGLDTEAAKTVMKFHRALAANKGDVVRSLLSDDVVIYEGGRVERSAEEYASHHMLADMKYLSAVDVQTVEHQVKEYGEFAISLSRSKTKGNYKGKQIDRTGMETVTLRKINGDWKITHIHWSN